MFLEESPEQQELRAELRRYYAELLTDEVRAGLAEGGEGGDAWREVVRQIGKDGWLGIGWPTEFGGQGRPATDQFIFFDETRRAGAPFPFVTINTVGPTIMRYGTEEQKSFFLPKILAGELNFAIGYTEPEAGTDLASLRTRAVRDGEEYVVNGAKIFTSGADMADYIWLATRTDPDAPKHKGISIICVPTTSPGFEWSIINTVGGPHHDADLLRQRARARRQPRRRGERGLAHDHDPAQPRARRPGRLERAGHLPLRGRRGVGGDDADRRGARRDRAALGADGPGQVQGRARGHVALELAHGGARRRR